MLRAESRHMQGLGTAGLPGWMYYGINAGQNMFIACFKGQQGSSS